MTKTLQLAFLATQLQSLISNYQAFPHLHDQCQWVVSGFISGQAVVINPAWDCARSRTQVAATGVYIQPDFIL